MDFFSAPPVQKADAADLDGLLRAARQKYGLSTNTVAAYQRTWRRLFAWAGVHHIEPVTLGEHEAARFHREVLVGNGHASASSQKQARAALAYAYAHWSRPDPFAGSQFPRNVPPPPAKFLPAHDVSRLLHHLSLRQSSYGGSLAYHLAAALFYTCTRYSELACLRWGDCSREVSGRTTSLCLRDAGTGGATFELPVNSALSAGLNEWRILQQQYRGMKVFAAQGLRFCRSEYVFAGPGGEPYTNQAFNARLKTACQELRLPFVLTAHGLRHSAARIMLCDQQKNLCEVQRTLRHRDIRTTARYLRAAADPRP